MKKEISVWQFVRIMVEAEENSNGKVLLNTYKDIWNDIDLSLVKLAKIDMEQYSAIMMENQVILDNVNRETADVIMEMASSVIERMIALLNDVEEDDIIADDLAFEIQGLEQLIDEFS